MGLQASQVTPSRRCPGQETDDVLFGLPKEAAGPCVKVPPVGFRVWGRRTIGASSITNFCGHILLNIHTYIHTYIRTYIGTYIQTYMCVYTNVYVYVYTYVYVYVFAHVYLYVYLHVYVYVHVYAHAYVYAYGYAYVHV